MLEIVGYAGFEFTIIDTEHGYFGLETAENLVRAAEAARIVPIIRVGMNVPHLIMKALDIGAQGVVVPQVTTRAEAESAIAASRYHPQGNRGACPCIRSGQHMVTDWATFAGKSNAQTTIILLIEGVDGMRNVRDILDTPGLEAVMLGPFDLSVALEVGGQLDHPKVTDFMKEVVALCADKHIELIVPNFDLDMAVARRSIDRWRAIGCTNFTVGTDKILFAHHMKAFRDAMI